MPLQFEGLLAPYGSIAHAEDLDVFARGTFSKSLEKIRAEGHPVGVYWFHKFAEMIGGVTKLWEDQDGLWVQAEISDTSLGRDIQQLIRDNHLRGLSVGFMSPKGTTKQLPDGTIVRYITEAHVLDCTILSLPADPAAKITRIRSVSAKESIAPAHSAFTKGDKPFTSSDALRDPVFQANVKHWLRKPPGFTSSDAERQLFRTQYEEFLRRIA